MLLCDLTKKFVFFTIAAIMAPINESKDTELKESVRNFWNEQSCDTQVAQSKKFSREYFEEIESFRYFDQPFIHSFAQFTRYRGKKVLEVGFGAGTDFIQWLRAGAIVSGVDLTPEALNNARHRIDIYQLPAPEKIVVADAENLPFAPDSFDLGYSFGVLHHTPDTLRALRELVRVVKPGGEIKVMLYNRHSVWAFNQWFKHALLKGRPWKSLGWVLWHFNESIGTKAYTRAELAQMLSLLGLRRIQVQTEITSADYLGSSSFPPLNWFYRLAILLSGERHLWHTSHYVARTNDPEQRVQRAVPVSSNPIVYTGNPLGFFHCITAEKI
jgi:ubiquinone/menaquinone biosynthesis C-methylase UbiE